MIKCEAISLLIDFYLLFSSSFDETFTTFTKIIVLVVLFAFVI